MSVSRDALEYAGEHVLTKFEITSYSGIVYDLRNIYIEINIYEDIFADCITGSVHLLDTNNLVSNAPFIGGEKVSIEFSTAGKSDTQGKFKHDFELYRVGPREQTSDRSVAYSLYFASKEFVTNQGNLISRIYEDTASNIAKSVLRELNDNAKLYCDETAGISTVVCPYWTPFQMINWLTKRAVSDSGKHGYVFFENKNGYQFRSIQETIEKSIITRKFNFGIKNQSSDDNRVQTAFSNIDDYGINAPKNNTELQQSGAINASAEYLDILKRALSTVEFNAKSEFSSSSSTGRVFSPNSSEKTPVAKYMPRASTDEEDNTKNILANRSALMLLNRQSLDTTIPGDSDLTIAQIVEFDPPAIQELDESRINDRVVGGKMLITALRHIIAPDKYSQVLKLSQNSYRDLI